MRVLSTSTLIASLWLAVPRTFALSIDITSDVSIAAAARGAADGLMSFYVGNQSGQTPGLFPQPVYWWEAGAAMNALLDYWRYTGDTTYNEVLTQAMLWQVGPNNDYMPPNQTLTEGNDDHGFWGLAAMSAAEYNYPNPPSDQPQWLALAQAVFNELAANWDTANCGGGLRWQIYQFNKGYDYKNSISQGVLFQLGARLARYTGNTTYADWANKVYAWMVEVQFLDSEYRIYDGASVPNCVLSDAIQWSYNNAMFLAGSGFMANYTELANWTTATEQLLDVAVSTFFTTDGIIYEPACENLKTCNTDQLSFKGYLAAYMGYVAQMVPSTANKIVPLLKTSAVAAAKSCTGGSTGILCGMQWTLGSWDGLSGVGEQLSALNTIQSSLVVKVTAPVTTDTGGTSTGNANAGSGSTASTAELITPATTGDKAGAAILTVINAASVIGCLSWLII